MSPSNDDSSFQAVGTCGHILLLSVLQALRCSVSLHNVELCISSCFVVFSAGFWTQRLVHTDPILSCVSNPCKVIFKDFWFILWKLSRLVHRQSQLSASGQIALSGILWLSNLSGQKCHRMWDLGFCASKHFPHTCSTDDEPLPWRSFEVSRVGDLTLFLRPGE